MKITPILANQRSLARHESRELDAGLRMPRTDYAFRETADNSTVATSSVKRRLRPELRAFRQMSQDLLAREERRNYIIEMIVFGLVIALIAWPLISLVIVLAQTARG